MAGARPPVRSLGALWTLLANMRIEGDGASRSFEQALADEQAWSAGFAQEVSREYRRFLYLAATSDEPVTPSVAVDKAWHLHLTYSRHYWEVLCGEILGRPLHHLPGDGGEADDVRHADQYAFTRGLYEATFSESPPQSIWPLPEAPQPEVLPEVHRTRSPIVTAGLAATAVGALFAGAAVSGVLGLALVLLAVGLGLAALFSPPASAREHRDGGCGGYLAGGDDGSAGCGSSCGGD